jgi:hypothetical protein
MPLKKIADIPKPCLSSEHNPPSSMVYDPGVYEWTCPSCGNIITFTVNGFYCSCQCTEYEHNHGDCWHRCLPSAAYGSISPKPKPSTPTVRLIKEGKQPKKIHNKTREK